MIHSLRAKSFSRGVSSSSGNAHRAELMVANLRPELSRLSPSFTLGSTPEPWIFASTRDTRGDTSKPGGDEANHRPESPPGDCATSPGVPPTSGDLATSVPTKDQRGKKKPPLKSSSFTFGSVSKKLSRMRKMFMGGPTQPSSLHE